MSDEKQDQVPTVADSKTSSPAEAEASAETVAAEEKQAPPAEPIAPPAEASPAEAGGDPGDESDHEEKELKDVAGVHFGIRGDHNSLDTFASKPVKQEEKK